MDITDVKINDGSIDVNGTCKQGNLSMGYDKLVSKLGEPIYEDGKEELSGAVFR